VVVNKALADIPPDFILSDLPDKGTKLAVSQKGCIIPFLWQPFPYRILLPDEIRPVHPFFHADPIGSTGKADYRDNENECVFFH
jgi:hypothetical protein